MPEGRILITRPAGQAAGLAARLQAQGFAVVHQPMLELEPLKEPDPDQRSTLLALDNFQHVIFVSANAVNFGMDWIGDYWPQLPVGVNWYTVGAPTADLLRDYGVDVMTPGPDMSSEGLLALPLMQQVEGDRVLIVKGEGGRQALAQVLSERGARVQELCCYRRRCPELPAGRLYQLLVDEAIDMVCLSAGEGLANFLALLSPQESTNLQNIGLLVPSQRVAEQARRAGYARVLVAQNASDDSMFEKLLSGWNKAGELE